MTVWPLFLLSMRALNSHAAPLLDEYEVVEVELPQPELNTDLADIILPFRQKREAERQYSSQPVRDIRERPVGPVVSPYDVPYQTSRAGPVYPQPRPAPSQQVRKHRRKTFVFPFPFISLKFKKFAVELSEYQ